MQADETHQSSAHCVEHVAAPIVPGEAAEALKHGPVGALVVASIAVAMLFIGWMVFYFLLFLPRGPVG
jgi:cytochrome b